MSDRWATATTAADEGEGEEVYIEGDSDEEVIATDDEEESDWSDDDDVEEAGKAVQRESSKDIGKEDRPMKGKKGNIVPEDLELAKRMHTDDLESDDEADGNTIGNVPLAWYDEYDHIGYDLAGKKIAKRSVQGDGLDRFLKSKDDPNFRRTIYDEYNQREVCCWTRNITTHRTCKRGSLLQASHPIPTHHATRARIRPDRADRATTDAR